MGRLVIYLKQHTPMLHFQHGQSGATLRATEVKPKLDKFIKKKEEEQEKDIPKSCLIDVEKDALDYKMKIELNEKGRCYGYKVLSNSRKGANDIAPSPYFAKVNKGIFHCPDWDNCSLKVTFFSLNPIVLDLIKTYVISFFVCTNFGTRNNKGFGSFTVSKIDNEVVTLIESNILKRNFDFVYMKNIGEGGSRNERFNILFSTIATDYRLVKSGSGSKKSAFFEYAKLKGYRWDKPFIKSRLLPRLEMEGKSLFVKDKRNIKRKTDVFNSRFVRPLLGLAGNYSFLLGEENNPLKKLINEKGIVDVKHNETNTDEQIERFPSPLLFKVIDNTIYLVGNKDGVDLIKNKKFSFMYKKQSIGELSTPCDFNLEDFLDFVFVKGYSHTGVLNYIKI